MNYDVYFILGAALGAMGHWAVKWKNGEIACVMDMVRTERSKTVISVAVQVVGAVVVLGSGEFEFATWKAALFAGATAGASIDALFNKGKREVWPAYKRAEHNQSNT